MSDAAMHIDPHLCTRCGLCAKDCPALIFTQPEKGALPVLDHAHLCIVCGHCVAVCPADAVAHDAFPKGTVTPIVTERLPGPDSVLELLRARRSIRCFRKKQVAKKHLTQIIDAAQLAPTSHNSQSTSYVVVQDRAKLDAVIARTTAFFDKLSRQLHNPVMRTLLSAVAGAEIRGAVAMLPELDVFLERLRAGQDLILRGGPCLIAFCGDPAASFAEANANLAIQNATLMAHALGVGSFWGGFVTAAARRDPELPRLLGVPKGRRLYGAMILGYPQFTHGKWVRRQPPEVHWES